MKKYLLILILLFFLSTLAKSAQKDYTQFVKYLKQKITSVPFKHSAYQRLAYITDTYGPRMWGSSQLQSVIQQMKTYAIQEKFQNIRLQAVSNFTKWVRRHQELIMISPRKTPTKLAVIGLGGSVRGNLTARALVVSSFQELEARRGQVQGKIVVFNKVWTDYSSSSAYRVKGASKAAKYGAVASLVRSVTPMSIYSVHTGYMQYDESYKKIPCGAITVQDAQMLQRMQDRGQNITLNLVLQSESISNCKSNNLIFQIQGSMWPQQIILAGGHIDTWDTGSQTGANDDGGGFISVFEAMRMLNQLGFRPKRTIRFVAWSGEQSGSDRDGAAQYLERHLNQIDKHVAAFQNDDGSTKLIGFAHAGAGTAIIREVVNRYLYILGAGQFSDDGYNVDIEPLYHKGVPMINNMVEDTPNLDFYYKYHHTAGDSMTMIDPDNLDSNVVGIAALLYIIADLQVSLRNITV